jgi:ribonuclease HI
MINTIEKPTECIIVDSSCLSDVDDKGKWIPIEMQFRAVHYPSGEILFSRGPWDGVSNNVGEFMALVMGMMYSKKYYGGNMPVYSDSNVAIGWVKKKKINSSFKSCDEINQMLDQMTKYLHSSVLPSVNKWHTGIWGENPADYGNK